MNKLHILHLSDLHERAQFAEMPSVRVPKVNWDARLRGYVLGPTFTASLAEIAAIGVDVVCFTGDLADWGHPDEFSKAGKRFDAILSALKVSKDRFFAVPGNHDIRRTVARDAWGELRKWCADTRDCAKLGRWLFDVIDAPYGLSAGAKDAILERSAAFWSWLESFGCRELRPRHPNRLGYRKTLPVGTFHHLMIPLHIVGLDSAWMCGGDDDQGKISATEEQVLTHIRDGENPLDGFRLALIHHPLDHLADGAEVRRLLGDNGVDLLLHGHQHSPLAVDFQEPGASLRILAAGCLMEGDLGKGWPNGFHLIEVDVESLAVKVHFRKWSEGGRFWAIGSDLYRDAPNGILELKAKRLGQSRRNHEPTCQIPGGDIPWVDQELIDELLRHTPPSERARLVEVVGDRLACPDLCRLVPVLGRCLENPSRGLNRETRMAFLRTADAVIRACVDSTFSPVCRAVRIKSSEPVTTSIESAVLAEILMAGAQGRAPRWKAQRTEASVDGRSVAKLRGEDLFYSHQNRQDRQSLLEEGPAPEDSLLTIERLLYRRLVEPLDDYDPRKHRDELRGELAAADASGRRLYGQPDPADPKISWREVAQSLPEITILIRSKENIAALPVQEHILAAVLRRFYAEIAPELLSEFSPKAFS